MHWACMGGSMHQACMGSLCTRHVWGIHAPGMHEGSDWLWWGHLTNQKLARCAWGGALTVCGGVHAPCVGGAHTVCGGCMHHAWGVNALGMHGGCMHWACVGVHTPGVYGGLIGCGGDT